jgi:hypothetical protein
MGGYSAAIVAVFSVVAMLLEIAAQKKQERKEVRDDANIQQGRKAMVDGDFDAVAADQHDRVLSALSGDIGRGDTPGQEVHSGQSVLGQRTASEGSGEMPGG